MAESTLVGPAFLTPPLRCVPCVQDGKHGKAWGVLTWRGEPQRPNAPTQMAGPLKRVWRAVQDGSQQQWQSIGVADTLRQEQQQAAAAEAPPAEETPAAVDKQASAA